MKLLKLVALSFVTSMSALGCSAGSEGDPADTDEAEGELAVGNQNLVGAFVFPGGGAFQALVLRSDGTFMADVDSGVRCASAPCTSTQRLTGNARVTKKTITLKAAEEVARSTRRTWVASRTRSWGRRSRSSVVSRPTTLRPETRTARSRATAPDSRALHRCVSRSTTRA